ncbi:MAG: SDR family NAD(P)-dependent oxidoreductase [Sphingomonadales bacterium]|nr:SDR family NAD(P)-dependent oxidoreductase [Sphingomonadales bacterium]
MGPNPSNRSVHQPALQLMAWQDAYRGRVVLISGASLGIGKELARQVWTSGGMVIATGRNAGRLEEATLHICGDTGDETRGRLLTIVGDVSSPDDCRIAVEAGLKHFGRIDYLIHNAAVFNFDRIDAASEQVIDQMIDVNVKGCIHLTRAALPALRNSRGGVLFVSSISAFYGMPEYGLYALSKAALTPLSESLRLENLDHGVFVGLTYLGYTANEPDKRALDSKGLPQPIPDRPRIFTRSREATARGILRQLIHRKSVSVPSFLGHINWVVSYLMPRLAFLIHKRSYRSLLLLLTYMLLGWGHSLDLKAQNRLVELTIQVDGLNITSASHLVIGLFDRASFPDGRPLHHTALKAEGSWMRWKFLVPAATYAVAVYQDLDRNGRLDKSAFGFPTEPYGFSRNYRPIFRGPMWKDAALVFDHDTALDIQLIVP